MVSMRQRARRFLIMATSWDTVVDGRGPEGLVCFAKAKESM